MAAACSMADEAAHGARGCRRPPTEIPGEGVERVSKCAVGTPSSNCRMWLSLGMRASPEQGVRVGGGALADPPGADALTGGPRAAAGGVIGDPSSTRRNRRSAAN